MCISVCTYLSVFIYRYVCIHISVDTILDSILLSIMRFQVIKIRPRVLVDALLGNDSFHWPTNNQLTNSLSDLCPMGQITHIEVFVVGLSMLSIDHYIDHYSSLGV